MRYLLWLWLVPLVLFWGWFGLSYYDINFGLLFLRRDLHNLVFQIYGSVLGIEPSSVPGLFLKGCIFDTVLIFAIIVYRKRRHIRAWYDGRRAGSPDDGIAREETIQVPAE